MNSFYQIIKEKLRFGIVLLFIFNGAMVAWAQHSSLTGKVTDVAGKAIPMATVAISGSSQAISTDSTGSYSLELKPGKIIIRVENRIKNSAC